MNASCVKCGSEKIIPLVSIMDQGQYSDGKLKAHVGYTNPEAWLFKGAVYARLRATICGECGHTDLTAENPSALYEAYLKTQAQTGEPAYALGDFFRKAAGRYQEPKWVCWPLEPQTGRYVCCFSVRTFCQLKLGGPLWHEENA